MLPLIKAIIAAIIVVGVGVPTAYVAYTYYAPGTVPMTNFIPQQSYGVVHYQNSTTSLYAYAANNSSAIIINYNLKSFESFFNSSVSTGFKNSMNASINVTELNSTYYGFSIYSVNGINLNVSSLIGPYSGLNGSLTTIANSSTNLSIYISPVESNYMIIGNLSSVKASINAEHFGTYMKSGAKYLELSGKGISFYMNLSQYNAIGTTGFNSTVPSLTIYGNMGATTTNITFLNANATEKTQISTYMSALSILSNSTISVINSTTSSTSASYELSIGYTTFGADFAIIIQNIIRSGYTIP